MVAAALAMGLGLGAWLGLTAGRGPWLVGLGGAVLGVAMYGAAALVLRSPEARAVLATVAVPGRRRPGPRPRRRFRRLPADLPDPPRAKEQEVP
jgi:hypothetical protein